MRDKNIVQNGNETPEEEQHRYHGQSAGISLLRACHCGRIATAKIGHRFCISFLRPNGCGGAAQDTATPWVISRKFCESPCAKISDITIPRNDILLEMARSGGRLERSFLAYFQFLVRLGAVHRGISRVSHRAGANLSCGRRVVRGWFAGGGFGGALRSATRAGFSRRPFGGDRSAGRRTGKSAN